MLLSFFLPEGGAAQSGWTSYPPLSVTLASGGQTWWLIGMVLLITSSLLGAINFIVTTIQLRATWCASATPSSGNTWLTMPRSSP